MIKQLASLQQVDAQCAPSKLHVLKNSFSFIFKLQWVLEKVGAVILHSVSLLEMQTEWNSLGLAGLAANPHAGGNVILPLLPPADSLLYFVLVCPSLLPKYTLAKEKQTFPHS